MIAPPPADGGGSTVEWDGSIGTLPAEPSVNHILMSSAIRGHTRITVSRNGGAFITHRLDEYDYVSDDLMQAIIFAQGQDQWSSVAFVHLPEMVAGQTGAMSICGINADGTVNAPHDATLNVLGSDMYPIGPNQPWHPPHTSRLERNWITFKPTPSVDPSLDMYYLLEGSDSKPWIIVESAAVIDLGTEGEVP